MGYLILLLILVAIIVYFWSYVKIILGVVGIITILKSLILIFSDDDDVKPTGIIFLIIGLALAIFFIFVPYWNVCKWILLGLGILAVMILVIVDIESRNEEKEKERKRLEKEHQKKLEQERLERKRLERKRVQSKLESTFEGTFLPIPEKLCETHNLAHIKSLLKEYNQLNKKKIQVVKTLKKLKNHYLIHNYLYSTNLIYFQKARLKIFLNNLV